MNNGANVFEELFHALESRSAFLTSELVYACQDVFSLLDAVDAAFGSMEPPNDLAERLDSLEVLFTAAARSLADTALNAQAQRRPQQRALTAIQEFDSGIEDDVRLLPRTIQISGRDLVESLGARASSTLAPRWRELWQRARPLELRDTVSDHLQRFVLARSGLDGELMLALSQTMLLCLAPWQSVRRTVLLRLGGERTPDTAVADELTWWSQQAAEQRARLERILGRYRAWASTISSRIASAVIRAPRPASESTRTSRAARRQDHLSFWARQHRAIQAVLDLERQLIRFGAALTREAVVSILAVDRERLELGLELNDAIRWLRQGPADADDPFPPPGARLAAAEERLSEWSRRAVGVVRENLPATLETIQLVQMLPGLGRPWRDLEPARAFVVSIEQVSSPILLGGLREAESNHRTVVRNIERAREVVNFGLETAASEHDGERYIEESRANALALLEHQVESMADTHAAVESAAVRAEALALLEGLAAIEKSRVGFLAYASGRRGREAWRQLQKLFAQAIKAGSRRFWEQTRKAYSWSLLKIGWMTLPPKQAAPIVRRPRLCDALELELRTRDLPAIYHRLFRLAPVEDARFLVGREAELAGLVEAERMWDRRRGASVIIVGARGSGKTSLLNCASSSIFSGHEIVRAQFSARLNTAEEMDAFLRRLFQLDAGTDLIPGIASRPRVVVLEELERTFLRVMNGFDALRRLIDVLYTTSRSTLWLFSVNETAFRYLDAVMGIGRHFSHRLNAMSVAHQDLTNAILQRHNLSGLRLSFAPLPEQDPRVSKIRRALGFEQDPQELFLDSLYNQSEGIFRSAFELWQACIERVEGGVVHMRQPLAPDYGPLTDQLNVDDYFILKAVLQHGSLTLEELGKVLDVPEEMSGQHLDRLQSLEILEIEAANPGLRIRPEAGRIVREALSRRNML